MNQTIVHKFLILLAIAGVASSVRAQAPTAPVPPKPLPPGQIEPVKDIYPRWSIVGEWRVTHPGWTNLVTLHADGSMSTPDEPVVPGKWILTADGGTPMLIFHWNLFGTESVSMVTPDHFRGQISEGVFMDMRRGDDPKKPAPEAK